MKYSYLIFLAALLSMSVTVNAKSKTYSLTSPDGQLLLKVELSTKIFYSLQHNGTELIGRSPIGLKIKDGPMLGDAPKKRKDKESATDRVLKPLYGKRKSIKDRFNELRIDLKGNYAVIFRMYDEGMAWRFVTNFKKEVIIENEGIAFNLPDDPLLWAAYPPKSNFEHSYENNYTTTRLSGMPSGIVQLPVLIEASNGIKLVITEADLEDYPGFHLQKSTSGSGIQGIFPKYPLEWKPGGHANFELNVGKRADYIAKTSGTRAFPWRVVKVATQDVELLDTDLVYKLSKPGATGVDFSWVKPGKVAWDWWNALNLTGVDFKTGINTETYKYFIDFASTNGIDYINLDEGWSNQFDLMQLSKEVDLQEIVTYAKQKSVGVILWCVFWPLDEKLEEAMTKFESMGIAGLKVDFMDRDDQWMVNYYHRIARAAANHHLMVNFHGAYKPAGLHRKYPNVINREAVRGLEYNKFSSNGTTPGYAVTIPFIRMVAGPMDYTPGAMHNAQQANYATSMERPMSMGTRCQQLAMYVVYEAPLQMLSDAPTAYIKEAESLGFIAHVPTTWDETKALSGKIGEYVAIARKKGDDWYIGAMTNWSERDMTIDFSFLRDGHYTAEVFKDGINANRYGDDYKKETIQVDGNSKLKFHLSPGGGLAIKLIPER